MYSLPMTGVTVLPYVVMGVAAIVSGVWAKWQSRR